MSRAVNLRIQPFAIALGLSLGAVPSSEAADFGGRFRELTLRASPGELYSLLYEVPKGGDLHNHSDGANRSEWIYAVCTDPALCGGETFYTRARFTSPADAVDPTQLFRTIRRKAYEGLPASDKPEYVELSALSADERRRWADSLRLSGAGDGRTEFFAHLWPRIDGITTCLPAATELLVESMKAFGAEHVGYLETQFSVEGMLGNDGAPVPTEQAVAFVRARLAQPDAVATGVTVRFQENVVRSEPDAESEVARAYAFVAAHRDLWVGLNLVGIEDEGHGYPSRFLSTFRSLRARYPTLALSIHAGEMDGPDHHVRDTLLLGATRIGHGVNLIQDPDTLLLLQQGGRVLVEVNLISNRLLGYAPDLSRHPFPEYLRTGVPVCLNTDDRGMWDSNMTDEYYTAVTLFHLSWAEIVELGRASLAHSFAQPEVRAALLARYSGQLSAFEARFGAGTTEDALRALATVRPVTYTYARRTWGLEFR